MISKNEIVSFTYVDRNNNETQRTVIPTSVPDNLVKAVDVTDLSDSERHDIATLLQEYSDYLNVHYRQLFSFEDWVEHTQNQKIAVKWRKFNTTRIK